MCSSPGPVPPVDCPTIMKNKSPTDQYNLCCQLPDFKS
jgi:hypothetical protein